MHYSNRPPPRHYGRDFDRRPAGWGEEQDEGERYPREHHTRQSGRWGGEEPAYGRRYGERPAEPTGGGDPNFHGPQYEQGGRYPGTREAGPFEGLRSRSADPGQSSYGGFHGEDPRWQRQQLRYGDEAYDDLEEPARWGGAERRYGWRDPALARSQRITPKGYVRSDERVREDLCERLSHSGLDVSDVSVEVSDGTVTLEGTVPNRATKHAIEDCADDCLGVNDIQNHIRVGGIAHPGMTRME
ncbi:BON domain-containing protein [Bordetella petrii]|uniref:BON domain-containing protein n=1 Tax=Bordetella petrii TaxID=94624 RepID=UPI001A96EE28|nr:BON domain-containing protein [Bordetella petrii]MBO1113765.1 BON domain-containing protein [Bordetella petrii]